VILFVHKNKINPPAFQPESKKYYPEILVRDANRDKKQAVQPSAAILPKMATSITKRLLSSDTLHQIYFQMIKKCILNQKKRDQ
jgi:hypothetical protein